MSENAPNIEELIYKMAITMTANVGPILGKTLISYCGSAKEAAHSSIADLSKIPGFGAQRSEKIDILATLNRAEQEYYRCEKFGISIIEYTHKRYPARLKQIDASPIVIYTQGSADLNAFRTVGIVGTRTPTNYGKIHTEKLIEGLGDLNVVTISGMAHGVDAITHRKSIEQGIPTIGILGCGIDVVYPPEHRSLYAKTLEKGGALISEFPLGSGPDKPNFPMRNRIIAAMSDATIVVESKVKGGSIITAEFANEYNKDVFAFPGKVDDIYSQGCNALIKKHKAHLLESVEDLKYIMRWESKSSKHQGVFQASLFDDLSPAEQNIINTLRAVKEVGIDELSYKMNSSVSETAATLLSLEFKGLIRSLPGKIYTLK